MVLTNHLVCRNEVDAVGMVEVSLMLAKCPLLSSISFSYNPIGVGASARFVCRRVISYCMQDIGMYFFLRGIMNPKRRAMDTLPLPPDPDVRDTYAEHFTVLIVDAGIGRAHHGCL